MRALLLLLVFLGVSQSASAQQLKIKSSDGTDIEVNMGMPGMQGGADPCNRYPFCNNCTMSVTNACGWCVETGQCVSRQEGACGQSPMAIAPTQCTAPQGGRRGPGQGHRRPGGVVVQPPPVQVEPQGMSPAAFQALLGQIKGEAFEEKKLIPLQSAARGNWFTVEQLGQLVDAFTFSAGKIKACEAVKARIVDRENLFMVYSHFTFEADKTKAQKVLEGG